MANGGTPRRHDRAHMQQVRRSARVLAASHDANIPSDFVFGYYLVLPATVPLPAVVLPLALLLLVLVLVPLSVVLKSPVVRKLATRVRRLPWAEGGARSAASLSRAWIGNAA